MTEAEAPSIIAHLKRDDDGKPRHAFSSSGEKATHSTLTFGVCHQIREVVDQCPEGLRHATLLCLMGVFAHVFSNTAQLEPSGMRR